MCAYNCCAQLLYTKQRGLLTIFPLYPQTTTIAQMLSIGGDGGCGYNTKHELMLAVIDKNCDPQKKQVHISCTINRIILTHMLIFHSHQLVNILKHSN